MAYFLPPDGTADLIPEGWTLDGYGLAAINARLPVRVITNGLLTIPEWAGAIIVALAPHMTTDGLVRLLTLVEHRPDRDTLGLIARLGGYVALAPLMQEIMYPVRSEVIAKRY